MKHKYRSELFQRIYDQGFAVGLANARAKAEAGAKARAKADAKAESILILLAARDIPVSDTMRQRILGCADAETLDLWLRRAAVVSTAAAVVRKKAPVRPRATGRSIPAPKT